MEIRLIFSSIILKKRRNFQGAVLKMGYHEHLFKKCLIFVENYSMPTLFYFFGLRFFFYSNDHEPIHVRVSNSDGEAKFRVHPLSLIENKGLKQKDIRYAEAIIEENKDIIIQRWNEFFKNK